MAGLLLAFTAAVLFGLALTIQKYAIGALAAFSFRLLVRQRAWLLSMVVGGAGILAYLTALRTTPLSAVQPLMAISLLIPILAGVAFFKENLTVIEWLLVALFLAGIGLVSLF